MAPGHNPDREREEKKKERQHEMTAVPKGATCLHLPEHLNLPTPDAVIACDVVGQRNVNLVTQAELVDLEDLLQACR